MKKYVALTFDVDFTNYLTNESQSDELDAVWPFFTGLCEDFKELKTTWFIRIDEQIGALFGKPDYIFSKHKGKISWLRSNGHEIGWHFHSYKEIAGKWVQNTNSNDVASEMQRVFMYVQKYDLQVCRMGWTYHTNETMQTLANLGIKYDFSAFPRPKYEWDKIVRDWLNTGRNKYRPSVSDYRVDGDFSLDIEEYPITTVKLPVKTDTEPDVIRYLNPAFKSDYFKEGLSGAVDEVINTVTHPYEILPLPIEHELLSFSGEVFRSNIAFMLSEKYIPITTTEMFEL